MRAKQILSLIVMASYLAGCTTWRVQPVTPKQLVETGRFDKVRVLTTENQTLVFEPAVVRNDSLIGRVDGILMGIRLDEIAQVEKQQTDVVKTVVLGVGLAAVVAIIAAAIAISQWEFCSWSTN